MADRFSEVDSEGVYLGMSLEDFGVRLSASRAASGETPGANAGTSPEQDRGATRMPRESLREAIEHLQGELTSGQPLSSEERERLERVLSDVSGILADEEGESDTGIELFDDVREFAEGFEESHPKLALVLGRIMDSLSQLGI